MTHDSLMSAELGRSAQSRFGCRTDGPGDRGQLRRVGEGAGCKSVEPDGVGVRLIE